MSKGLIAALALVVFVVGAMLAYIPASNYGLVNLSDLDRALAGVSSDKRKHIKAEYYEARCADSIATGFLPFTEDARATVEDQATGYAADKADQKAEYPNYCDLAAQYRSAAAAESSKKSAWFVVGLTAVGVFLLFLTLRATNETLDQARLATIAAERTTDVTREVGEAAERAILRGSDLQRPSPEHNALFLHIVHYGETSAYNVAVQVLCRFRTKDGKLEKIACEIERRELRELSQGTDVTMSFDFGVVRHLQTIGECLVPTTLIFEVEVMYEDVFTIGTGRDVIVSRQTFNGIDTADKFDAVGRFEIGKKDRQKYEIARVGPIP